MKDFNQNYTVYNQIYFEHVFSAGPKNLHIIKLLSEMFHPEFEELIDLPRKCMEITGVWPKTKQTTNSKLRFFVIIFQALFFMIIPQVTKLFYVEKSLYRILDILLFGLLMSIIYFSKLINQWFVTGGKLI